MEKINNKNIVLFILLGLMVFSTNTTLANTTAVVELETESEAEINVSDKKANIENRVELRADMEEAREERKEVRASSSQDRVINRVESVPSLIPQREELEEMRAERKSAIREKAQVRITELTKNLNFKLNEAISKTENVINRLNSRIDKLEAAGLDVTEARMILQSTDMSMTIAVDRMTEIDAQISTLITSEDPRKTWLEIRTQYQSVRNQLKNTHDQIKESVAALKTAVKQKRQDQSSTTIKQETAVEVDATMPDCPDDLPGVGEEGYHPMQYADCKGGEIIE